MGLKTSNYKVEELNITIDNAYAKISNLTITRFLYIPMMRVIHVVGDDVF